MMRSSQSILKVAIAVLSLLVPPLQHTVALLPNSITYARAKFAKFAKFGQYRHCNNDRDRSTMLEASRLSPMVDNMAVSKTIEIHALTMEMKAKGQVVYSLCVGEPDYQPPEEVLVATGATVKNGNTKYTSVSGEVSLRENIAKDLKERKGITYDPNQIVVSNGAKQSVIQSLLCTVTSGDEVVIPAPYWPSYPDMVKMCGAQPVVVNTLAADNYIMDSKSLRNVLQQHPRTKAIILCNPSNPTGGVASLDQLIAMAKVLEDFSQVIVIADEIYEQLTYNTQHVSFASLPAMFDRTITINGFSKSHSMTGYRVGYSASATDIAKGCSKLQSQMTSCASSISQHSANIALTQVPASWMQDRRQELLEKRDFAYDMIMSIPGVSCPKPDGAFYLLPDVSAYYGKSATNGKKITNPDDLCLELLREQQVALVSGNAFGASSCIRLSYAASKELIEQSISRLKTFLMSLS